MEKSDLTEFQVTVRLIEDNQEIATLEKCFGFVEILDEQEDVEIVRTVQRRLGLFY